MKTLLRILSSVMLCGLTVSLLKLFEVAGFNVHLNTDSIKDDIVIFSVYIGGCILIWVFYFMVLSKLVVGIVLKYCKRLEDKLLSMSFAEMIFSITGCIAGLSAANLIGISFWKIPVPYGNILTLFLCVVLGSLGFNIVQKKKGNSNNVSGSRSRSVIDLDFLFKKNDVAYGKAKILDTSVIIDGRILDIIKTGFIEGKIIIPNFVLEELRHIADSSDPLKRSRGRLGLDVLNQIQSQTMTPVEIIDWNSSIAMEVDSKLLKMAAELDTFVVTNDYNLNKVAEFQKVAVLNINELSNAVKAMVLPGQDMKISVIKDGKEAGQGIAYLNDGTMIVVENGRQYIGEEIDATVTSVLQTAAGRMIFVKPISTESEK